MTDAELPDSTAIISLRPLPWPNLVLLVSSALYVLTGDSVFTLASSLVFTHYCLTVSNNPETLGRKYLFFNLLSSFFLLSKILLLFLRQQLKANVLVYLGIKKNMGMVILIEGLCLVVGIITSVLLSRMKSGRIFKPKQLLRITHIMEYSYLVLTLSAILIIPIYPLALPISIFGALLICLKAIRANTLYCFVRIAFYTFILLALLTVSLFSLVSQYSTSYNLVAKVFLISLSILQAFNSVFWKENFPKSFIQTPPVYFEQLVPPEKTAEIAGNVFSRLFCDLEPFIVGLLMIIWCYGFPCFAALIPLVMGILLVTFPGSQIRSFYSIVCFVTFIIDSILSYYLTNFSRRAMSAKFALILLVHLFSEMSKFLKSNSNSRPIQYYDWMVSLQAMVNEFAFIMLMTLIFYICLTSISFVNGILLGIMILMIIYPSASRFLWPFLIIFNISFITIQAALTSIIQMYPSESGLLNIIGFQSSLSSASTFKYFILLYLSKSYQNSWNPASYSDKIPQRWNSFFNLIGIFVNLTLLPLLLLSLLLISLSSENVDVVTIGYLLLFFWFSFRGMFKNFQERQIFLVFTTFYSAMVLSLFYFYQLWPIANLIDSLLGRDLLSDFGFYRKDNITHNLVGYLIILVLARLKYFIEYQSAKSRRLSGFISKNPNLVVEIFKRFMFLHNLKILAISLTLSAISHYSIFGIANLVISFVLLFDTLLPQHSAKLLTFWVSLDVVTKFVFHFKILDFELPNIFKLFGFVRDNQAVYVFDLVSWQVIALIILAFQGLFEKWKMEYIEGYGASYDIPLVNLDLLHFDKDERFTQRNHLKESAAYYSSFLFKEFGREITIGFFYFLSLMNRNIFGLMFCLMSFLFAKKSQQIPVDWTIFGFLGTFFIIMFQYLVGYLHFIRAFTSTLKYPSISKFLGLGIPQNANTILMFIGCILLVKLYRLEQKEKFSIRIERFTQISKDLNSISWWIKRQVVFLNLWFAYILGFISASQETSLLSLITVLFSLYYFRIGEYIYLQKFRRILIPRTWTYLIIWSLIINILATPTDYILILAREGRETTLPKILAFIGLKEMEALNWNLSYLLLAMSFGMLLLQNRVMESAMMQILVKMIIEENNKTIRRANRFHLHRIEELKQQMEIDSAAAEETKRRIKERSGINAKIDISDWQKIFPIKGEMDKDEICKSAVIGESSDTLLKRNIAKFSDKNTPVSGEEKVVELRVLNLEEGPEELFSPIPQTFTDIDESKYPMDFRNNLKYYFLVFYFWILRKILKFSEEYRHICELKETYQMIEQVKISSSSLLKCKLMLYALYYALLSHFHFAVFLICLGNTMYYANLFSVFPTFLVLISGACQRPYTRKYFWRLLLRYVTLWIFILFFAQSDIMYISAYKDYFRFSWGDFIGVSGFDTKLQGFFGPIVLLMSLIMQRAMMRYLGMWKVSGSNTREEKKIHRQTVHKTDFNIFEKLGVFAGEFGGFMKSIGDLPGKDFYLEIFLCDLLCFIIICVNWNVFSGQEIAKDGTKLKFLTSVLKTNLVPTGFVVLAIMQSLLIIFDRVIYCKKALKTKVFLQLASLLIYHVWIVFLVPLYNHSRFRTSGALIIWYIFKFGYWYFSALQVKHGYPMFRTSNFLFRKHSLLNYYSFLAVRSIPLFMEIRNIIDWTFTESTLSLYGWFKFEQWNAMIYGIMCNRKFTRTRLGQRHFGTPKTTVWKIVLGLLMVVGILLLVFFPLVWVALPLAMKPNPIHQMRLKIGIDREEPFIDKLLFTLPPQPIADPTVAKELSNEFYQEIVDCKDIQLVNLREPIKSKEWVPAEDIEEYLRRPDPELWMQVELTRGFSQTETQVIGSSRTAIEDVQAMVELFRGERNEVKLKNLLPRLIISRPVGMAEVYYSKTPIEFTLSQRASSDAGQSGLMFQVTGDSSLYLYSQKISASKITNFGIIGLYVTFVVASARMLKRALSDLPYRIPLEDLPNVETISAMCEDLLRVREFGDFFSEETIFYQLIQLIRNSDLLLKVTSYSQEDF